MASNKKDQIKVDGIHGRYGRFRDNRNQNDKDKHQVPFLVRTHWKNGQITLDDFNKNQTQEILLYLFLSSKLRDIVDQLKYQLDGVYRRDIVFKVSNVYLDQHGVQKKKDLGTVHSVKSGKDESSDLRDHGFKIGDILMVEIETKNQNKQPISQIAKE
ncbi:unnamed protein product (macronuclear) [Paramecium tetraurelia]|uniref:S1 motif domain-containing protein n=1 Tax=Paramecium tetraurelia TaxID=5888 RepID=A0DC89_PARTE|nr:uncharacterized protein GSPATT00015534001 [Paramecium tetraurelia]CAK80656.1 unnamed protein product [Paramecium tetraurelia]|eukprot:XP_001448053.1 hypothetical protein (macronuclear) [Paramecium tetraurelia strain d4-2]